MNRSLHKLFDTLAGRETTFTGKIKMNIVNLLAIADSKVCCM